MRVILLIVVLCCSILLRGQEVLSHLVSNPIFKSEQFIPNKNKSALTLPFFDDFSYSSPLADAYLWQQSSVFINQTYPINPITVGVATFDGLNKEGLAYTINMATAQGDADTLLSQEIDLSAVDTAYFMFYFQPQGVGDNPQVEDSLMLEFKDSNGDWNVEWKIAGSTNQEFKKKVFLLKTADYLFATFQFRFRNKATLSGNFDHWHIDYIKLDEFLNPIDTSKLNDISFVYGAPSFLKRYEQMPWTHFKNNELSEMNDTVAIFLRNN
jgi:hypothetical protein